jgi:hypothetical protein
MSTHNPVITFLISRFVTVAKCALCGKPLPDFFFGGRLDLLGTSGEERGGRVRGLGTSGEGRGDRVLGFGVGFAEGEPPTAGETGARRTPSRSAIVLVPTPDFCWKSTLEITGSTRAHAPASAAAVKIVAHTRLSGNSPRRGTEG